MALTRSLNALGVPDESCGVDSLDKVVEVSEDLNESLGPGNVVGTTLLVLLQHSVAVELGRADHLLDERSRLGGHGDPAKGRNALSHSREVVELGAASVGILKASDGTNSFRGILQEAREGSLSSTGLVLSQQRTVTHLGRLLGLGGNNKEGTLGSESALHISRLRDRCQSW